MNFVIEFELFCQGKPKKEIVKSSFIVWLPLSNVVNCTTHALVRFRV